MLLIFVLVIGHFDGLFLWAAADNSAAVYCQLVNDGAIVSGDCYSRSVDIAKSGGLKENHFAVEGTDGPRVALRVQGLFGTRALWGTAIPKGSGFVLELSSPAGVQTIEFRNASAPSANAAMAAVAQKGAAARSSAELAGAVQNARNDYYQLRAGLPRAENELTRARRDSAEATAKVDAVRRLQLAIADSIRAETVDWKRGTLEGRLGAANGRMNAAQTGVLWVTQRIAENTRQIASMRAQMKRDSLYVVRSRAH